MGDPIAAPRHARRRVPLGRLAVVGAVAALAAGSGTHAWWSAEIALAGETLTAGDLWLTTEHDDAVWRQVTPGLDEEDRAGGALSSLPEFVTMPGDVLEVVLPVTTFLRGDNMRGGFRTVLEEPTVIDDGLIAVGFHVEDESGTQVAPLAGEAAYGTVLTVPGLVGDSDGRESDWNVVVRVHVLGDYVWSTGTQTGSAPWHAGEVEVRLQQVRATDLVVPEVES